VPNEKVQQLVISGSEVFDYLFEYGEADAGILGVEYDTDSNGPVIEVETVYVTGSAPIGTVKSITAVNGVDRSAITSAGLTTTTLTEVNEPETGLLVEVGSVESGTLTAVNGVDRG
jgi:hypothetical protein